MNEKVKKMGKNVLLVLCLFFYCGCSNLRKVDWEIRGKAEDYVIQRGFDFEPDCVTCSFAGGTIEDVVEQLPEGVSVVYDEQLLNIPIFAELRKVTYAEFFAVVSRALGCDVYKIGDVWIFGRPIQNEDENTRSRVSSYSSGNYTFSFKLSGLEHEKVISALGSSVVYVGGSVYMFKGSVIEAVECSRKVELVRKSVPSTYVFDVHFVSDDLLSDFSVLGGDTTGSISLSYMVARNSPSVIDWSLVLSNAYDVTMTRSSSSGIRTISGVFREDKPYVVTIGDEVPYIKKNILENGTIVDSDVQYQNVGIRLQMSCEGDSIGVVNMDLSVQDATNYVNGYPVKHGNTIKTSFLVSDDKVHYVGSFYSDVRNNRILGLKRNSSRFYVLCRVVRVSVGQSVFMSDSKKNEKK